MLSRVAERLYWFARYVERAESTARLLLVYHQLVLDLPLKSQPGWGSIIDLLGGQDAFGRERARDEREVIDFVFSDCNNASSIVQCISAARENLRTTREVMPSETWEMVNALHLHLTRKSRGELTRATRHALFNEVIRGCQLIDGMLAGCMNHGDPYQFILIGRNLERADMTTRIVDVGSARLMRGGERLPYANVMWMSVLKSLSAYQMYRQHVRRSIRGRDVLDFLLRTRQFPRALMCCINVIERSVIGLPRGETTIKALDGIKIRLAEVDLDPLLAGEGLQRFIDELQMDLARVHQHIVRTWFRPDMAA